MSPDDPADKDHEKHLQLGADPSIDDRDEMTLDEIDEAWAESMTVEQYKTAIEDLRDAGWPEGET